MEKSFTRQEIIGEEIKVVDSTNKTLLGVEGVIVDETQNMIVIGDGDNFKKLRKSDIVFELKGKGVIIDGRSMMRRPHERIKMKAGSK